MRFRTPDQLREHLDWIFKRNRSKRAHDRGTAEGGLSRCWYESWDNFLGKSKDDEAQKNATAGGSNGVGASGGALSSTPSGSAAKDLEKKRIGAIRALSASEKCAACGEEVDAFWDDEQESWMLPEATRTEDGVFHTKCMSDSVDMGSEHRSASSTAISPTKSEKDEPAVDHLPKLESKTVLASETREARPVEASPPSGVKREREDARRGLESEAKQEPALVSEPASGMQSNLASQVVASQETGSKGQLGTGPQTVPQVYADAQQPVLATQGKKRARDEGTLGGINGGTEGPAEGSPEKRAKV